MSWLRFIRRRKWDEERKYELQTHLDFEMDRNTSRELLPDEARYAAQRKLGNATIVREEIDAIDSCIPILATSTLIQTVNQSFVRERLIASLIMISVALFAEFLPARRASRVDPMVAFRYE